MKPTAQPPGHPGGTPPLPMRAALLLQQGDASAAARLCRQGLRKQPAHAELWRLLGLALLKQGDSAAALEALRKAVLHGPGSALAHLNLGSACRTLDLFDDAVRCFTRAIELDPRLAAAHHNLGNAHLSQQQLPAAVQAFDAATALAPSHFGAWFNRGHALKALGRLDEAAASYRRALAIEPGSGQAWWALADHKGVALTDQDVDCMQQWRSHPALSEAERTALEFALARALEGLGRDEQAFACLISANRRQRARMPYERAAHQREVDAVIKRFSDPDLRPAGPAHTLQPCDPTGAADEAPIFIVSLPRSGSTLVDQILSCHTQVTSTDEPDIFERLVQDRVRRSGQAFPACLGMGPMDPHLREQLARDYLGQARERAGNAPRFTDKSLGHGLLVGLIASVLPQARFVLVERDPMDTGLSCWRQFFARGHAYSYDLSDLGHRLQQHQRLVAHWQAWLPERVLRLRYEDLVQDLPAQARRLLDFCGLDWQPQCLDFHHNPRPVLTASAAQVREPINTRSIGRWKRFEAGLRPLRQALYEATPGR